MSFGMRLLDLLERSVLVQAFITAVMVGAVGYLYVAGRPVPDELLQLTWAVLAFWMGSKTAIGQVSAHERKYHDRGGSTL